MLYPESVSFLYSLGNEVKTVRLGLESIRTLLGELGNPQDACPVVHVAGTNGKGSTSAMIEAGLRAAGYRTGLYTSPHLVEPVERIRVDGTPVTKDQFVRAFNQVHLANERLLAAGRLGYHTTYFETVTAMGFLLMKDARVDIAVVEVGLGGRLDATNVVHPSVTVITPVDFDHEVYLGTTLEAIAGEKAGILKPGVPAVFARQRPEAAGVLERRAADLRSEIIRSTDYRVEDLLIHAHGSEFRATRTAPLHIRCPLAGTHQIENALTAVAALEQLGIDSEAIERGIGNVRWPARLQTLQSAPEILLDGAHNPAGARALADHIRHFYQGRRVVLIYGAMRDKSVGEITEILFPLADEVIVTAPESARAVRPEALVEASDHSRIRPVATAREALAIARTFSPETVVVITGSLYLAGEILALIQ